MRFARKAVDESERKLIPVVSLWLKNENVADFEVCEGRAARVLEKHGGRIELAVRIKKQAGDAGKPFEIHVVSFPNEKKFADYQADSETRRLAEQRDEIIARIEILYCCDVLNLNHE